MNNKKKIYGLMILIFCCTTMQGIKYRSAAFFQTYVRNSYLANISSERNFDYVLRTYTHVVAYVHAGSVDGSTKALLEEFVRDRFEDFVTANVKFIAINSDQRNMQDFLERYKLAAGSHYLLFFHNRRLVLQQIMDKPLTPEVLDTFIAHAGLENLVDQSLREQQRAIDYARAERITFCDNGCGRYCGHRPCHWKGGYDWGWPYYGYYYGPYWSPYWAYNGPAFGFQKAV
jgi:hypothetical protein